MPADYSSYIDLRPTDLSPTDIYISGIRIGQAVLPEFDIRQGTPDDAMLQAFAYMTSLNVAAINRLPDRVMEALMAMMGVQRFAGIKATAEAVIFINNYENFILPEGTVFLHSSTSEIGAATIAYVTAQDYVVAASSPQDEFGNPNPLPQLTIELVSRFTGTNPVVEIDDKFQSQTVNSQISFVEANGTFSNGTNPEPAQQFLSRAVTYLASLSSNIATGSQVKNHILSTFENVLRCKVYELTNALVSTDFDAGDAVGHAAIFVNGVEGALAAQEMYDILLSVSNKSTAGIQYYVNEFSNVNVGVTVSVKFDSSYTQSTIEEAVQTKVFEFLNPDGFTSKAEAILTNELTAVIATVPGVVYVESVTLQDIDSGAAAPDPLFSIDANGNWIFLKKGILPISYLVNLNVTASLPSQV